MCFLRFIVAAWEAALLPKLVVVRSLSNSMKTNYSPSYQSAPNDSSVRRWLLPGIISLVAAVVLTFLLAPMVAGLLNLPTPSWLSPSGLVEMWNSSAEPENPLVEIESTESSAPPEDWPAPPDNFLAASGPITKTVVSVERTPTPTRTPLPTPTIVALPTPSWSEMNHLTSVTFNAATIVEAERETTIALLGDIRTDRLLLKVVGDVLVGIDLDKISNVETDGTAIRLSLPAPEILSVEILPQESQIFESTRTLFLSQYDGLETEALEKARQQLRIEITQNDGLMELARDKSRLQLTEFLESVGFQEIEINFPYLNTTTRG